MLISPIELIRWVAQEFPRHAMAWLLSLICALSVSHAGEFDYGWDMQLRGHLDQPIIDKLGKGWFMNVGPTGVRAKITRKHICYFTVTFVFENSPAAGKINAGDIIIGANGKVMDVPHNPFMGIPNPGGFPSNDGPMTEMAKLIENAQGKDGKLDFIVWPGGDQTKQKVVPVLIEAVGRFSPTYPFNCKRSAMLHQKLCDFLGEEYKAHKRWLYLVHSNSICTLAIFTSNNPEHQAIIKNCGDWYAKNNDFSDYHDAWGLGFQSVVLGEYYLLTRDQRVLPAIENISKALSNGMNWSCGSYSHITFPSIMERVHKDGSWGYGPMSNPGGLAMLGLSLYKEADLPYPTDTYQRIHQAFLNDVDKYGCIGYGFRTWESAIIKLKKPDRPEAKSTNGIGYICPHGIKGMGEFTVVPPPGEGAKPGDDNKDKSWLVSEAAKVRVYDMGGDLRMAVRDMTKPEPVQPYPVVDRASACHSRMGLGVLAHTVGNSNNIPYKFLADHMANACANGYDGLLDGHGCGMLHALFGTLGASKASPAKFRKYMDSIKWWFIMAETHNGGFVVMPGRDWSNDMDVYSGNRNLVSATAALILNLREPRIHITGMASAPKTASVKSSAEFGSSKKEIAKPKTGEQPSTASSDKPAPSANAAVAATAKNDPPASPGQPDVSPEALAQWHVRLIKKLDSASKAGRTLKFDFEDGHSYQVRGADDQALHVKVQGNELKLPWRLFSPRSRSVLAKIVADEEDAESLLIAAVYELATGRKEQSEILFAKAKLKDAAAEKQARATLGK